VFNTLTTPASWIHAVSFHLSSICDRNILHLIWGNPLIYTQCLIVGASPERKKEIKTNIRYKLYLTPQGISSGEPGRLRSLRKRSIHPGFFRFLSCQSPSSITSFYTIYLIQTINVEKNKFAHVHTFLEHADTDALLIPTGLARLSPSLCYLTFTVGWTQVINVTWLSSSIHIT